MSNTGILPPMEDEVPDVTACMVCENPETRVQKSVGEIVQKKAVRRKAAKL